MVEEVSRLLSQARGAYQREQYQVALAYFQQACQVDSHSPEALLGLGEVSSFLGFRDQAINAFLSLADLYLRAAMFEIAAEVIERILDLDPANPVGLRFQRFIQPRLRPSPSDQITAVTAVERPTPMPTLRHARGSEKMASKDLEPWDRPDSASPTDINSQVVNRELDDLLGDMSTPPPSPTDVGLAPTQLAQPVGPVAGATHSRFKVTINGLPDDDDDDDDDSEVRTKTFDGELTDLDPESKKNDVIFDFGDDDDDDDLVVYTVLDPEAAGDEHAPLDRISEPDRPEAGDTAETERSSAETAVEIPTPLADNREETDLDPNLFGDVSTRAVPDEMLEAIAKADGDPFSSDTAVGGDLSRLLARRTDPQFTDTDVASVDSAASGTGTHESVDPWDVNTEAAVLAENFRKRPAARIDAPDDELDLADFPSIEERDESAPVTSTIALEHKDALLMLEELAPISPFITQLGIEGRFKLVEKSALLQCFAGQVVCSEGDTGRDLYLLLSGQAAVERAARDTGSPQRIASLSPGAFFGEGSVLADAPRSSTVRIIDDALLIEIPRAVLQELVRERPHLLTVLTRFLRARLVSALMMSSPLFGELDVEERAALAPLLHLHKLNAGQQVVRRGQLLTGYCTVMAGELERFDLAEGTGKQFFGPLRAGDSFGTDCLRNKPSSLSVGAVTGCWLMRLPTENLRNLVESHPGILEALTAADLLV